MRRLLSTAAATRGTGKLNESTFISAATSVTSSTGNTIFKYPTIRELLERDPAKDNQEQQLGKEQTVMGYIRTRRKTKACTFVELSDGTTYGKGLQLVIPSTKTSSCQEDTLQKLSIGTSLEATGVLQPSPHSEQSVEMLTSNVRIVSECSNSNSSSTVGKNTNTQYPIQKKAHSLEYLRTQELLRPRTKLFNNVLLLRDFVDLQTRLFFHNYGFVNIHTPILTSSDCEGGGEVFRVSTMNSSSEDGSRKNYFKSHDSESDDGDAYLSVSAQLHLEIAHHSISRVYTLSPCFRADPGSEHSPRHLSEFYMLEAEWNTGSLEELMDFVEMYLKHILRSCHSGNNPLLKNIHNDLKTNYQLEPIDLVSKCLNSDTSEQMKKFPRLKYSEAVDLLQQDTKKRITELTTENEKLLTKILGGPVFVTHYPSEQKPFYMLRDVDKVALNFDLLVPEYGELAGGSLRVHNHKDTLKSCPNGLEWYSALRMFGSMPHGGFGLGFDRMLLLLTGLRNIRDTTFLPRHKTHLKF
jgi:asparaginyl-tRNA synthetase